MRFPIASVFMIVIGGFCMFLYIIFRYALVELRDVLWGVGNNTLTGDRFTIFNWNMQTIGDGFGMTGLTIFALAIIFFLFDVFSGPRQEMY